MTPALVTILLATPKPLWQCNAKEYPSQLWIASFLPCKMPSTKFGQAMEILSQPMEALSGWYLFMVSDKVMGLDRQFGQLSAPLCFRFSDLKALVVNWLLQYFEPYLLSLGLPL